ncbi:MAG: ECF-type sigma factor [Pseudomonadota bacterium]
MDVSLDKPDDESVEALAYLDDERHLVDELVAAHYAELLEMARKRRRRAGMSDTLQTDDVLHKAYLKLMRTPVWQSDTHFLRTAALAIRHVVVSHARHKLADKRGGASVDLDINELDNVLPGAAETPEEVVTIGDLLTQLEQRNARWARVVDARYFGGMTEDETARALDISPRTVRREWQAAKLWLAEQITPNETQ